MLKFIWRYACPLICSLTVLSCATGGVAPGYENGGSGTTGGTIIRIGLETEARSITVEGTADIGVTVGVGRLSGSSFTFIANGNELRVTGSGSDARGATALCTSSSPIRVGGTAYRGSIEIKSSGGTLTVVNIIDVESYLRGVVPREIGYLRDNEIEAMKAQAVAARTYTLAHLGRRRSLGFDLYADTRDQVYGGSGAESTNGDRAVQETSGKVMVYNDELIEAFFHSTCGGSTANIEDVWNPTSPAPYLRRAHDSDDDGIHCQASPHFRWTETYTGDELRRIVSAHLRRGGVTGAPADIGRIRDVSVEEQTLSGRATVTRIISERGTWRVRKDKIRQVLRRPIQGNPPLRSSYIRIAARKSSDGFITRMGISGGGFGHGIGMCQWGAIGMSRKGYRYQQILQHYYQGIQIVDYQSVRLALGNLGIEEV